jgi:hypothetical protein
MASSLQEYLKRYTSDAEDAKKKKKKKKMGKSSKPLPSSLTLIDADPVWQKQLKEESSESEEQGRLHAVLTCFSNPSCFELLFRLPVDFQSLPLIFP